MQNCYLAQAKKMEKNEDEKSTNEESFAQSDQSESTLGSSNTQRPHRIQKVDRWIDREKLELQTSWAFLP